MNVQMVPVSTINPAPYNPRKDLKPGDPAYEKIKRSLDEFGTVEPLVWNRRTGNLVGGHQRLKILVSRGEIEVPCVVVDLEIEREMALNIALNKVQGDWEEALLADLIQDLTQYGADLTLTGFDEQDLYDLLRQADVNHATDFLNDLLAQPDGPSDQDRAGGDAPLPDPSYEPLETMAEAEAMVTLTYVVATSDRTAILQALNHVRSKYGIPTHAEALVFMCREYRATNMAEH